jgi:hypothetical protein
LIYPPRKSDRLQASSFSQYTTSFLKNRPESLTPNPTTTNVYRRINDALKGGNVPKAIDVNEWFETFGDPVEHHSLLQLYLKNAEAKKHLDRIRGERVTMGKSTTFKLKRVRG